MLSHLLALTLPGPTGTPESITVPKQIQSILDLLGQNDITDSKLPAVPVIGWLLNLTLVVAAIATLAYLLYGGWKWITSQGDPKNLETAHNIIIYAAVGLAIVMLSAAFINAAATFFCIPFLGLLPQSCP